MGLVVLFWLRMKENVGKIEKGQCQLLIQFLFFSREFAQSNSAWMLCTVSLLLQWRPSKIGLTSSNVIARRFLMSPDQGPHGGHNVSKIHDLVMTDRQLKMRRISETVGITKKIASIIYCMKNWSWESWWRYECRVCSHRTTSATVTPLFCFAAV